MNRDDNFSLYEEEINMLATKQINISVKDYSSFLDVCKKLDNIGIMILNKVYDTQWRRYDIYTIMNKDQAYEMLDYVNSINGILWKGES